MSSNFFPENSAACKIMWKNIDRQATDDNITWRMRVAWLQTHTQNM